MQSELLYNSLLFFIPIVLLFFIVLSFRYLRKARKLADDMKKTEMSFVVDTFHELVAKLKEKEKELEELRKRAEERAEDVESYSDNIIESVPSGVVSFDNNLRITRANSSAIKILGLTTKDLKGLSYDEVFYEPLKGLIEKQDTVKRAEYLYRIGDGISRWLGLTISPLYNRKKEKIGKVLIFSDITELKDLERQIRLREWLSSLGEVSLGIAHELRNPMAVISGYSKLLKKNSPEEYQKIVDAIMDEIKGMDRIINDFLSFARPVNPNKEQVNLRELITEALKPLVSSFNQIIYTEDIADCRINTDPVLIKQAITNIARNSIEAMEGSGELRVLAECVDQGVRIVIEDSGGGIPEDIKEKIFLPFYTTKENGTGLGLAVVHKNITTLGGTVMVENINRGSRFTIELPIQ